MTACPDRDTDDLGLDARTVPGGRRSRGISSKTPSEGGVLGVEHDPRYIKSNQGRTYMAVRFRQNVVRWSESFLSASRRPDRRSR